MRFTIVVSFAAFIALPSFAYSEGFEVIVIGNKDINSSQFSMISLRKDMQPSDDVDSSVQNARPGVRFRLDASKSTFKTDYDAVSGAGTGMTYRLLLSFGIPMDAATVITLTGGVSHHIDSVSPVTFSSPAGTSKTAEFLSIDLEYSPTSFGTFQGLAEHDGAGANFAAATYLINIGENFRFGPTVNYIAQGEYSRDAIGVSAVYLNGDQFEIKATVANASQQIGSNLSTDVDYVEVQIRTTF